MRPPTVYETWQAALDRVESLKRRGIWPAIIEVRIHDRVFAYRLTHDPPFPVDRIAKHGGLRAP